MKISNFKFQISNFFVPGFRAAGIHCGIKKDKKKDLALIYSEVPANVAGVFTTSKIKAAPVLIDRQRMKKGLCQAVIVNSGNANACTGKKGLQDARTMVDLTEKASGIKKGLAMVSSTGVIGQNLPMNRIEKGIKNLKSQISSASGGPKSIYGWQDAAQAIMTTDTFLKIALEKCKIGGKEIAILGIAKGAGMICPRMATMLAFLATDAVIERKALQTALNMAVDKSFNSITVDGDTSTNDTVLILANGKAGNKTVSSKDYKTFCGVLKKVCLKLSHAIVRDGEGATKFLEIRVKGARRQRDAKTVAMTVANSLLVKTAFFGEDTNWGRIMAAIGRSGIDVREEKISVYFDNIPVVKNGRGSGKDRETARVTKRRNICLTIDLGLGRAEETVWTTDLSYDYIKINAAYRT